ncbi:unnamed protein product, partial [Meganyctiphanes norvegica]
NFKGQLKELTTNVATKDELKNFKSQLDKLTTYVNKNKVNTVMSKVKEVFKLGNEIKKEAMGIKTQVDLINRRLDDGFGEVSEMIDRSEKIDKDTKQIKSDQKSMSNSISEISEHLTEVNRTRIITNQAIIASLMFTITGLDRCPTGFFGFVPDQCFKILPNKKTSWSGAQAMCREKGLVLAE